MPRRARSADAAPRRRAVLRLHRLRFIGKNVFVIGKTMLSIQRFTLRLIGDLRVP
jgi:hypothetical protein